MRNSILQPGLCEFGGSLVVAISPQRLLHRVKAWMQFTSTILLLASIATVLVCTNTIEDLFFQVPLSL